MTKVSKMIDHWTGYQLEDREAKSLQAFQPLSKNRYRYVRQYLIHWQVWHNQNK